MILYIDPGTGSMLFAALLGVASTLYFLAQQLWIRLKYRGGKVEADTEKKALVIFGEGGQYWKVFKPVCDELEKRGFECEYYTMDEHDPVLEAGYEHVHASFIGSDNRAFAKLNLMKAYICLSTTPGLGVYQWKRSKGVDKYVHIFHDVSEGTGYRMFGMDDYDAILLTGEFQGDYIRRLEELRGEAPKELTVVGSTYMDALMARKESAGDKQDKKDGKTVLLAPSWGQSAILSRFGEKLIDSLLKTGYHIIIRPHPQTIKSEKEIIEPLKKKYSDEKCIEWDEEHDNFGSLSRADVMITDFSGVIFDFAFIFDKPVIYADTKLDTAPYDAAWLDEPVWRLKVLPQLGEELQEDDFERIKELINKVLADDHYQAGRKSLSEMAWQKKGKAAQNVADYILARKGDKDGAGK